MVSRTKYGSFDSGPFVVIVCFGRSAFILSAAARYRAASAEAPLWDARSAAQTSPAITDAMVDGDQPSCSSQRSCCVYGEACPFGPLYPRMKSAAFRTPGHRSVRPSCWASTIGNAVSSSWTDVQYGTPSTRLFCGRCPSGCCWVPNM